MAWTITNEQTNIKFVDGTTIFSLSKGNISYAAAASGEFTINDGIYRLKITDPANDVTSPTVESAVALANAIETMQKSAASDSSTQTEVAFNNASTQLVAANADRKGILVTNKTDVAITIELGNVTVVLNEGMHVDVDKAIYIETTEEVKFICATATSGKVIATEFL